MPKRSRDYRVGLLEDLKDPQEATNYLNAALEDSDEMFLTALRDVAEAKQMAQVAGDAGVAREALYRMLSKNGNPRYSSLTGVLRALGLRMEVASAQPSQPPADIPSSAYTLGSLGSSGSTSREIGIGDVASSTHDFAVYRSFETGDRPIRNSTLTVHPAVFPAAKQNTELAA